ncbi:hypothetical protein [Roseibacillus persicicus]|uniref:hypothetical protein n=1 Tax=Roseibacillus persicicus TaxID=454148 RepID=UPI00280D0B60|nr:hypothetical protein [Roseibacillus persicicus]MDQ8190777.1 hypothetical protein [Roseibacillus persicicus]
MKVLLSLLLTQFALIAAEPTDFIRVVEDEKQAQLQTSITTYRKGDTSITLIGAIHIADEDYFQALNKEFTKYPVLLFELIGGENAAKTLNGKPREKEEEADGRPAEGLRGLYGSFASTMQLAEQIDLIDYTKENFVHADLTMAEYQKLTEGKSDEVLAFALQTSVKGSEISGKPFGGMDMGLVMRAILSGDSTGLKLQYMTLMEQGDESTAALTGKNLVISDRNDKCFAVLAEQRKKGAQKIGIFYGAAHFPDMERRLLADGFEQVQHDWLTAWHVKKPAKQ